MLGIIICIKQYSKLEGTLNQLQKPALFVSFFVFLQVALERGVGGILRNKTRASSQGKGGGGEPLNYDYFDVGSWSNKQ